MKIAIIQYPGTNCEYETCSAIRSCGIEAEIFRWNRQIEELEEFDAFVLAGGFSYQDRVRAGAIAAKKPIIKTIMRKAEEGAPVLGICNGAQILIESGICPSLKKGSIEMALSFNRETGFLCDWVYVKVSSIKSPFLSLFNLGDVFPIPIAHAEGRFATQNKGLLLELIENDQIALRYCTKNGEIIDEFPINPNGSIYNIAGLTNKEGNVFALMPHPERASFVYQIPRKKQASARKIFEGIKDFYKTNSLPFGDRS
ncbi:MAG: phosphoribosylformylglycinamidine synthase I [bacterium]